MVIEVYGGLVPCGEDSMRGGVEGLERFNGSVVEEKELEEVRLFLEGGSVREESGCGGGFGRFGYGGGGAVVFLEGGEFWARGSDGGLGF